MNSITIGIEATNLRRGGGRTNLIELLKAAKPGEHGIIKIVVWGSRATLAMLENASRGALYGKDGLLCAEYIGKRIL